MFLSCAEHGSDAGGDPSSQHPAAALDSPFFDRVRDEVRVLGAQVAARPDDANLRTRLGEQLLRGVLVEAGEAQLRKALEIDPGHEQAACILFDSRFGRGDPEGAAAVVAAALQQRESADLRVREGRAMLRMRPEEADAAEASFRRALAADPQHVDASFELAQLLLARGDAAGAVPLLEAVCRRQRNHVGAHFALAKALRRLGREDEARRVADAHRRLAQLDDLGHLATFETPEAALALAFMLHTGGDQQGALRELEQAMRRHPRRADLAVEHAELRARSGAAAEAVAELEQALRRFPDEVVVLDRLARMLATHGRTKQELRRALLLAERAATLTRHAHPGVLHTLGEARAALGENAAALAALEESLRLAPGDEVVARRVAHLRTLGGRQP